MPCKIVFWNTQGNRFEIQSSDGQKELNLAIADCVTGKLAGFGTQGVSPNLTVFIPAKLIQENFVELINLENKE